MRFDTPTQGKDQDVPNGDRGFLGLRMKTPREQLPTGYYARGENVRIGRGLETRPGTKTPIFANLFSGRPIHGSGLYSNPNGDEVGLLALSTLTSSTVVAIRAGTVPTIIPVTGGAFGIADVEFTQHFDKILAHQSSDPSRPTYIWDGVDYETGFVQVSAPSVDEPGIKALPNPPWSVNFLDRAWFPVPGKPDTIAASDENDPTTYDSDLHEFRVNTGTADAITGAYPFFESSLIIGKRRSIDILKQIPQDLGDSFIFAVEAGAYPSSPPPPRIGVISTQIGILARKSAIMAGGAFMFLSDAGPVGGIYRITTDEHGQYIVDPSPVSEEIEPLIQRINWPYADKAIGTTNGHYAMWAVPLDGALFNNVVLVLNLRTGEWESVDIWKSGVRTDRNGRTMSRDNPMQIDNIFRLDFYGASQLFAVDNTKATVHLLYAGLDDQLETAIGGRETMTYPIQSVIETRGYQIQGGGNETNMRANFVNFALATLAPNLTFDQLIDGDDGEENQIGPTIQFSSRGKYLTARAAYVLNNKNDDAEAPGRQDYSVQVGDGILLHDDGVRLQRVWPWTQEIALNAEARFLSFRLTNVTGICQLRSVLFEGNTTRASRAA